MDSVVIFSLVVAIIFGAGMLTTACVVFYRNQFFGWGGGTLTVCGSILVGLSVLQTVEISVTPGGRIEARFDTVREQLDDLQKQNAEVARKVDKVYVWGAEILEELEKEPTHDKMNLQPLPMDPPTDKETPWEQPGASGADDPVPQTMDQLRDVE